MFSTVVLRSLTGEDCVTNPRATALVKRLGFIATHRFRRPGDGREFVQYEREVSAATQG